MKQPQEPQTPGFISTSRILSAPHPNRLIKDAPTHDTSHSSSVAGEGALWQAVITQALMDSASNSKKPDAKYHRGEAIHWLLHNTEDFSTVCYFAGLEPDYVRRMAKRALARNCKWRAEPGSGKQIRKKRERDDQKTPTEPEAPCRILPFARSVA